MDSSGRRERCARCTRPPPVCYCASLPPAALRAERTQVLVLQHPHEKRHRQAISSVPVLAKVLHTTDVVTVAGHSPSSLSPEALERLINDQQEGHEALLVLFPDANAHTLNKDFVQIIETRKTEGSETQEPTAAGGVLLLVIDGTWTEAKKIMFHYRAVFESLAQQWRQSGRTFAYVCLEDASAPRSSIYGELRREPMEGCLSTLEAVALALKELEPGESGDAIQEALLQAFKGMVDVQDQFRRQGRERQLQMYKGVTKQQAMQEKLHQAQLSTDDASSIATPSLTGLAIQEDQEEAATPALRMREYVFYLTQQDFRQRKQLVQQGPSMVSTYNEAREHCQKLNKDRKRGQRLAVLPVESFLQQQQQQIGLEKATDS